MRLSRSLQVPGNVWCTTPKAGYSVQDTHCACWNAFRIRCVAAISGWRTAIAGAIRVRSFFRGKEWQAQRIAVCRALGHPTDGGNAVKQLATELDETWKTVASRFELNAAVSICHQGKYPSLTISSLEKLEEPQPLILLNSRVRQLVPPC